MKGINKVFLLGHLGKDPEVRETGNGQPVANFVMATSDTYTDKDGNKQEQTEWHNIVAWGNVAKVVESYLKKGSPVHIEGKLQTNSWEDNEGNKRYKTEIILQKLNMLSSVNNTSQQEQPAEKQEQPIDDGLPF